MAKNKTAATKVNVFDFIDSYVDNDQKKADSLQLIELMQQWSGCEPYMYGPTIIGFGNYHYKYESGHEGDAPLLGFAPRKPELTLYVYHLTKENDKLLEELGKYKMGKSCIYIKKLSDINIDTLEKISKSSLAHMRKHYDCTDKVI